jgi:uncharacterized protein (TIGR03000 family)
MLKQVLSIRALLGLAAAAVVCAPSPASAQIYESATLATPNGSYRYVFPVAPTWLGYPWGWNFYNAYSAWSGPAYWGLSPYMGIAGMNRPLGAGSQAFAAAARPSAAGDSSARLDIRVPATAVVQVQGRTLDQDGATRRFQTPPIAPNQSRRYTIQAVWTENGHEVSAIRQVSVQAGDRQSILFMASAPSSSGTDRVTKLP